MASLSALPVEVPVDSSTVAWGRALALALLSRGLGDARLQGLGSVDADSSVVDGLVSSKKNVDGLDSLSPGERCVLAKSAMSSAEQKRLAKLCDGPRLGAQSVEQRGGGAGNEPASRTQSLSPPGGDAVSGAGHTCRRPGAWSSTLRRVALSVEITSCAGRTAEALVHLTHEFSLDTDDKADGVGFSGALAGDAATGLQLSMQAAGSDLHVSSCAVARIVEAPSEAEASHRRSGGDAISYSSGGYTLAHLTAMSLSVVPGSETEAAEGAWSVRGAASGSGSSRAGTGAATATAVATLSPPALSAPALIRVSRTYLLAVHSDGHMLPFALPMPSATGVPVSFTLQVGAIPAGPGTWADVVCPTHEGVVCTGLGSPSTQVSWEGVSDACCPLLLLVLEPSNTTWLWQSLRLSKEHPLPAGLASVRSAALAAVAAANWAGRTAQELLEALQRSHGAWAGKASEPAPGNDAAAGTAASTASAPPPPLSIPRHIAIVMDGNGRWAKQRGLNRSEGHKAGVDAIHRVIRACRRLGVRHLTLYAFSHQNWSRPPEEVKTLMRLLMEFVRTDCEELIANGVRLLVNGDISRLPAPARRGLRRLMDVSKDNTALTLILALSYGGREEILRAVKDAAHSAVTGELADVEALDCKEFRDRFLPNPEVPDPDLLVRTSGELRVSNFLLWHIAYTEIWVSDQLWPDFDDESLVAAIRSYSKRERRFGLTSEQLAAPASAATGASGSSRAEAAVSYGVIGEGGDSSGDDSEAEAGDPLDWNADAVKAGSKGSRQRASKGAASRRRAAPSKLQAVTTSITRCTRVRLNAAHELLSSMLYMLWADGLTAKAPAATTDGASSDEDPASVGGDGSASGGAGPVTRPRSRSASLSGSGWSTLSLLLWVGVAFLAGVLLPRGGEPGQRQEADVSLPRPDYYSSGPAGSFSASASCTSVDGSTCPVAALGGHAAAAAALDAGSPSAPASCPAGCRCWCARTGAGAPSEGRARVPASASPPRPSPAPPPSKAARPLADSSGRSPAAGSGADGSWLRSLWQRLKARGASWGLLSSSSSASDGSPKAAWEDAVWIEGSPDPETGNTWGWVEVSAPAASTAAATQSTAQHSSSTSDPAVAAAIPAA